MKIFVLLSAILAMALTIFSLRAAQAAPFTNYAGTYSQHGSVDISDGNGPHVRGKATLNFKIGANGNGRLKIVGTVKFAKVIRPFSSVYVFRPLNNDGIQVAKFSNIAPVVDDGFTADRGTYTATPRSIRASSQITFGTTTGTASALIRLRKRAGGTEMIVFQTLSTNTLTGPITWKFSGILRP